MTVDDKFVEVYKKQVEVAREFGVTEATVHNWIKSSEAGNNNLKIRQEGKKKYIVKDEHNVAEMTRLKERGRKHASNVNEMNVYANEKELVKMFGQDSIRYIINYIDLHNNIPIKYRYFNGGAKVWDDYYKLTNYGKIDGESFDKLFHTIYSYLDKYEKINVIEVGCGNGLSSKEFVRKIKKTGKLDKFVITDISSSMLDIAYENLHDEFGKHLVKKPIDFEINSFQKLLFNIKDEQTDVANLVLFVGGTIGNYPKLVNQVRILSNIRDGMTPNDFLLITNVYDKQEVRTIFPKENVGGKYMIDLIIPSLLGIEENMYSREFKYNDDEQCREFNLVLKYNINIHFKDINTYATFKAGDKLNVWHHRRDSYSFIADKLERSDLSLKFLYLNESGTATPWIYYLASVNK